MKGGKSGLKCQFKVKVKVGYLTDLVTPKMSRHLRVILVPKRETKTGRLRGGQDGKPFPGHWHAGSFVFGLLNGKSGVAAR